ncbi:MAG: hypothetical protein ACI8XO_003211 [Verrucomicrobiales bacterium]|jgi:hypothetical protein
MNDNQQDLTPDLLPTDGGESFPGITHGLISLGEPFRLHGPEELVPDGMKLCKECLNAENAARHQRRKTKPVLKDHSTICR